MSDAGGLSVDDLAAGYGPVQVVKGVSFDVAPGALVAFIGPNGHGKTTILRAISGLVRAERGAIRLGGSELSGLPAERIVECGVIHIPQGDMIFPGMSVIDNLLLGAHPRGAYRRRAQLLSEVFRLLPRLHERRGQLASTLSGGERRMLAIGRGLMASGKVLLVDEPSLGLAPIVIDQIYAILARLKAEGRTILLVEETASRVVGLADQAHLIDDGRIVWSGTGDDVGSSAHILATYLGG